MDKIQFKQITNLNKKTIKNYQQLINLIIETGGAIGYLKPLKFEEAKELLEPAIENPNDAYIILAYDEDRIIGSGRLIRRKEDVQKHVADMTKLMVHPDYRNKYIGEKISRMRIDEAKKRGIEILFAEVRSNNILAINLCKKLGFNEIFIFRNTVKINLKYLDTICFRRDIKKRESS